jgi:hypothetical protein
MSRNRIWFSWLRQCFRLSSFIKIVLLTLIIFFIIIYIQIFKAKNRWCNPEKALWWFCSWPGEETICNWDKHFPIMDEQIR